MIPRSAVLGVFWAASAVAYAPLFLIANVSNEHCLSYTLQQLVTFDRDSLHVVVQMGYWV